MTPTDEEYYDRLVRSTSSATPAFKTASQVHLNRNDAHDVNSTTGRRGRDRRCYVRRGEILPL